MGRRGPLQQASGARRRGHPNANVKKAQYNLAASGAARDHKGVKYASERSVKRSISNRKKAIRTATREASEEAARAQDAETARLSTHLRNRLQRMPTSSAQKHELSLPPIRPQQNVVDVQGKAQEHNPLHAKSAQNLLAID